MTLNNRQHKNVTPMRRERNKMSSMIDSALYREGISEPWQREGKSNTGSRTKAAKLARIWETHYKPEKTT